MFSVDRKTSGVASLKAAVDSGAFLKLPNVPSSISTSAKVLAGHNRFATQGAHTDENAHPFMHGTICMMHNGTLDTRAGLSRDRHFVVDSEHIAYTLAQCHTTDDIIKVLEDLDGAFALVWYNDATQKLYFARNDERELAVALCAGTLYWASEIKMMEWLLDRNRIYSKNIKEFPSGQLMCVDMSDINIRETAMSTYEFTPKEVMRWNNWYGRQSNKTATYPARQTQETGARLEDIGYVYGEEVSMVIDRVVKTNTSNTFSIYGHEAESDYPVAIHGVSADSLPLSDTGYPKTGVTITSAATHVTKIYEQNVLFDAVALSKTSIVVKQDTPSRTVAGKEVSEEEWESLKYAGCNWCGHPFSDAELATAKADDEGYLYHREDCHDAAVEALHIH